jgi:hypothetical protein
MATTTTLPRQRETTHDVTIPMPRVTPTASLLPPMQLSEQTLAWLAERSPALHHLRAVWEGLTDSAERPDLVATLRAILIDHHVLTRPGRVPRWSPAHQHRPRMAASPQLDSRPQGFIFC